MNRLLRELQRLAPIEWFRVLPSMQRTADFRVPPLIVWRFVSTAATERRIAEIENQIFQAVGEFHGRVEWVISKPGRNIVLTTKLVSQMIESNDCGTDVGVLSVLSANQPEHGHGANADLEELSERIAKIPLSTQS